ncbi:phenol hydroxylase subunit P4 [Olivibacter jilunii]
MVFGCLGFKIHLQSFGEGFHGGQLLFIFWMNHYCFHNTNLISEFHKSNLISITRVFKELTVTV